jgi:hypothetical protein
MLEVHRNVVASDVRSHSYNWRVVKLPNEMCGRDSVQIGHDYIHKDKVVSRAAIQLVHRFQTVQLQHVSHTFFALLGVALTALSIEQWKAYKNFVPMRRQVWSSSTSNIDGWRIHPGSIVVLFFRPSGAVGG